MISGRLFPFFYRPWQGGSAVMLFVLFPLGGFGVKSIGVTSEHVSNFGRGLALRGSKKGFHPSLATPSKRSLGPWHSGSAQSPPGAAWGLASTLLPSPGSSTGHHPASEVAGVTGPECGHQDIWWLLQIQLEHTINICRVSFLRGFRRSNWVGRQQNKVSTNLQAKTAVSIWRFKIIPQGLAS